jgi:hypothetical protein
MNNFIFLILLAVLAETGCHKKESLPAAAAAPAFTADATNETAAVADSAKLPPLPPTYIATKADNVVHQTAAGEVDSFMTRQLHIFVQQKGRMPVSFTEFANTRLDSVPRPPDGTKWVIDATAVQVKAVPIHQ